MARKPSPSGINGRHPSLFWIFEASNPKGQRADSLESSAKSKEPFLTMERNKFRGKGTCQAIIRIFFIDQHIIVTERAEIQQITPPDGSTTNDVESHRYYCIKDLNMGPKDDSFRALILGSLLWCGMAEI